MQGDQELVRRPGPWRRTHESDRRRCCGVRRSGRSCYDYVRPQPFTPAQASRGTSCAPFLAAILTLSPVCSVRRTRTGHWTLFLHKTPSLDKDTAQQRPIDRLLAIVQNHSCLEPNMKHALRIRTFMRNESSLILASDISSLVAFFAPGGLLYLALKIFCTFPIPFQHNRIHIMNNKI